MRRIAWLLPAVAMLAGACSSGSPTAQVAAARFRLSHPPQPPAAPPRHWTSHWSQLREIAGQPRAGTHRGW